MADYLDEKEKRYVAYFGEPVSVAHDVFKDPHVDVYIFTNKEQNQFFYLSKGLEEAGFRELLMVTTKQKEWPVFFLQSICNYQIGELKETGEKKTIRELETYEDSEQIKDAHGFNYCLFLETSVVGLDKEDLKTRLGLANPPLYVFPLTKKELKYSLEKGVAALLEKLQSQSSPLADVNRKSVV